LKQRKKSKFAVGLIFYTPGAIRAMRQSGTDPLKLLARHVTGDWGELDAEDCQVNDDSARYGGRILSAYRVGDHTRVWVITEADRSATTFLLPSEY